MNYTDQDAIDAATGFDVIYVPRQTANFEAIYSLSPTSRVDVTVSYVGDQFNDAANTQLVTGYWLTSITYNQILGDGWACRSEPGDLFNDTGTRRR